MKKKIRHFFENYDWLWSVPAVFILFWLTGVFLKLLDQTAGSYDIAFFQPIFLCVCAVILATAVAKGGLYFYFKGPHNWFYGKKENGKYINKSKESWQNLEPKYQFLFLAFIFFYYVTAVLLMYAAMI